MSFLGSQKTSKNSTVINNDNRTQNNSVAAQNSNVVSTAGGSITTYNNAADVQDSLKFASDFAHSILGTLGDVTSGAISAVQSGASSIGALASGNTGANESALQTVAALKQGDSLQTNETVIIVVAVGAAAIIALFLFKKH